MEAKEPCIDCPDKVIDSYGYFCDIACGKRTAWQNFIAGKQEGIKEVVEWIKKHSQVEHCDPDVMAYFNEYRWVDEEEWQAKLKDWAIWEVKDE